jgi:GntR family transcriptional repressor for pyruvate dehydrogenase complex
VKILMSTKVLNELTSRIENEVWKPGQKLPSLSALATEFSVGVSTMREAMRILEDKGYIAIEHGRGMYVRSRNQWKAEHAFEWSKLPVGDMFSLLELREMLEPEMAALAAERGTAGQIRLIKDAASEMIEALAKGEDYFPSDLSFHAHIAEACANDVMAKVMNGVSDMLLESRRQTTRISGSAERASHFHMLIALAIEQRNSQLAKEVMKLHLLDVREDYLHIKESL